MDKGRELNGFSISYFVTVHPLFFEKIKPSLPTVAPYD